MNYKPDIQEKILGIFTPVRCLNEQQFRQYAAGRLPAVEQHLIQQHLVDCELCNEAVEAFRRKGPRQKFEAILPGLHGQIRKAYFPVLSELTPAARKIRNLEKERRREKLLISTWSVLLGAICLGGILFLAFHYKNNASAGNVPLAGGPPTITGHGSPSTVAEARQQDSAGHRETAGTGASHNALLAENKAVDPAGRPITLKTSAATVPHQVKPRGPEEEKKKTGSVKPPVLSQAAKQKIRRDSSGSVPHHELAGANLKNDTDLGIKPVSLKGDRRDSAIHVRRTIPPDAGEAGPPQTDPDEVLYTSAKSYLAQGNVENAISRFKFLASDAENKYYQQARFQLALCYKAKGRNGKARKLLKEIVANGGTMKTQAQVELESLQ